MSKANKNNNFLYNPQLKSKARTLRKNMTRAEVCLWKLLLRNRMLSGHRFNRQRSVSNYIVDFICKDLVLIIEIDGYTHFLEEVVAKDEIRQKYLENVGFTVLRYSDNDVLTNIDSVAIDIENNIKKITAKR